MNYNFLFDVEESDDHEGRQKRLNLSYNLWSNENAFPNPIAIASSPATASLSSGSFSFSSTGTNVSDKRRSSTISPAVSSWSNEYSTPPVTPQNGGNWCPFTPLDAYPKTYFNPNDSVDNRLGDDEDLWMSKSWDLPLHPLVYNKASMQYCNAGGVDTDITALPFAPHRSDPPLSQRIFAEPESSSLCETPSSYGINWSAEPSWPTAPTIAPKQTFEPLVTSSPTAKMESSSPLRVDVFNQQIVGVDSSPLPTPVRHVVPSQGFDAGFRDRGISSTPSQPIITRRLHDRHASRQCNRRAAASTASKPRKCKEQSSYEAIVPQNTFTCTIPGCADKYGRPKRFKRQEHRKRHELSVLHDKTVKKVEKTYLCWVPNCSTGFTRTDNLKAHIKNTHGKNGPAQRNRYVATLDPKSKYYDDQWQGELTDDGFPLKPGVASHRCCIPECGKLYHLKDKLKAHLLQQHGERSPDQDDCRMISSDGEYDFDSDPDVKNNEE